MKFPRLQEESETFDVYAPNSYILVSEANL